MPTTAIRPRQSGMADALAAGVVAVSASSGSGPPGKPAQELIIRSMQITCARRPMSRLMLTRQQATRSIAQQAHHVVAVGGFFWGAAGVGVRVGGLSPQPPSGVAWGPLAIKRQRRGEKRRVVFSHHP